MRRIKDVAVVWMLGVVFFGMVQQASAADAVRFVKNINEIDSDSIPILHADINGTLFFHASDDTSGWELWKSDGTAAGTVLVKDINPGAVIDPGWRFAVVNGTFFFNAADGTTRWTILDINDKENGTVQLRCLGPQGVA